MRLTFALLALSPALSADTILDVGYFSVAQCDTSLTSAANSKRLDVGPCVPALTFPAPGSNNEPVWVSASASPFEVAIDGAAGFIEPLLAGVGIHARATWEGQLYAFGDAGEAFMTFQLIGGGNSQMCLCEFMMPSVGIHKEATTGPRVNERFSIPVTFGEPIGYRLSVFKDLGSRMHNDLMGLKLSLLDFSVVDASGSPIPGASVVPVVAAPEPAAIWLFAAVLLFIILRLPRRAAKY